MSSLSKKSKASHNATTTTSMTPDTQQRFDTQMGGITDVMKKFMDKPHTPFAGPMVAGLSPSELRAREIAGGINGATQVQGPAAVDYRTFDPARIEARMNPYQEQVVDRVSKFYDEDLQKKIQDNQSRATMSKAFGGSRHGIADAELMRTSQNDKAGIVSDLNFQGWESALGADERESANIYGAGVRNSEADYGARRDNAVRNDDAVRQNVDMMNKLGMQEREIEQAKLLAEKAKYDEAANEAWKRLVFEIQTRFSQLGATPMLTTTNSSGSSTSKTSDPIGEISSMLKLGGSIADGFAGFFK